jgi:hypothetical protein
LKKYDADRRAAVAFLRAEAGPAAYVSEVERVADVVEDRLDLRATGTLLSVLPTRGDGTDASAIELIGEALDRAIFPRQLGNGSHTRGEDGATGPRPSFVYAALERIPGAVTRNSYGRPTPTRSTLSEYLQRLRRARAA